MKYTSYLPDYLFATVLVREGARQLERTLVGQYVLTARNGESRTVTLLGGGEYELAPEGTLRMAGKIRDYVVALSHELPKVQKEGSHGTK